MRTKLSIALAMGIMNGVVWGADDAPLQYQWADPKTGKVVTKDYPPANLQMRQVDRRGNLIILEVIGQSKFSDAINLATPKSAKADQSSGSPLENCISMIRRQHNRKDPESVRIEGAPAKIVATATGEVRNALLLDVNAKNSYGAYGGSKLYRCILGADNVTPIDIKEY